MKFERPHPDNAKLSPNQRGLVEILADMVRSALAWENDLEAKQCPSKNQVDGRVPGVTLSPQFKHLPANPQVKEVDNATSESE